MFLSPLFLFLTLTLCCHVKNLFQLPNYTSCASTGGLQPISHVFQHSGIIKNLCRPPIGNAAEVFAIIVLSIQLWRIKKF